MTMKNLFSKKSLSLYFGLGLLIVLIAFIYMNNKQTNYSSSADADIPTYAIHGNYDLDMNNKFERVGSADYVFVGTVTEDTGVVYENHVPIEQEDGSTKYIGDAYSNYKIKVVSNLKNELVTYQEIPIKKQGGIREDGSAIDIFEDDVLPEVGETYIFIAYAQEDGSLRVAGPNSTIPFSEEKSAKSETAVVKTDEYKSYENAVENQIEGNNEPQVSTFDSLEN